MATTTNTTFERAVITASNLTPSAHVPFTVDSLRFYGIDVDDTPAAVNAAHDALRMRGAIIDTNPANNAVTLAADIALSANERADRAQIELVKVLAILDETEAWRDVVRPDTTHYTSVRAFRQDVFPMLAESTLRNYVATGRAVYLPAFRGEFDDMLAGTGVDLRNINLSEAMLLKSALSDDKTRAAALSLLPQFALRKADGSAKVTRATVKAVQSALKEGNATGQQQQTLQAAANETAQLSDFDMGKRFGMGNKFSTEVKDGEFHLDVYESNRKDVIAYLTDAVTKPDVCAGIVAALLTRMRSDSETNNA